MRSLALAVLLAAAPALAADAKKPAPSAKAEKKDRKKVEGLNLDLKFDALPSAAGSNKPAMDKIGEDTRASAADATFEVIKVQHAKAFSTSAKGAVPIPGELSRVLLKGKPPATEKFSSAIRVRCAQRASARIEVVILDPRGDTALSANGDISYRVDATETEWVVDWDPTPLRGGGEYKVLVRIAGQPMGTWPLQIVAQ